MDTKETIVLGGGCFWCTEAIFKQLKGVTEVTPGYAGGVLKNPTYEEVATGKTGYAEVVKIEYDPKIIPTEILLEIFMHLHDPTQINGQGADIGTQYRSVIFYTNSKQEKIARKFIKGDIVTQVEPLAEFYEAEEYHKDYYKKNSDKLYCRLVIDPKLEKLRKTYQNKLTNVS